MHLVWVHQKAGAPSLMASEKWFATASCILSCAIQRNAAARSIRSAQWLMLPFRLVAVMARLFEDGAIKHYFIPPA